MSELVQFAPAIVLTVLGGALVGLVSARLARTGPLLGMATGMSVGVILGITLSPTGPIPEVGSLIDGCDLRRWGPGTLDELLTIGEASLNVALFMPLGACLGFHSRPAARRLGLIAAGTVPFLIELIQLKVPTLGRYCDSVDITHNELGLLMGFAAGTVALWLGRKVRK